MLFDSTTPAIYFIIKIALLIFLSLYIIFAGIVVKQIRVMTDTLEVGFEKPIKIIGFVHFAFSVIVFFSALVVL